jgi:hypothetical protein
MKKVFYPDNFTQNIMVIKTALQHNFYIKKISILLNFRNININMIFHTD